VVHNSMDNPYLKEPFTTHADVKIWFVCSNFAEHIIFEFPKFKSVSRAANAFQHLWNGGTEIRFM
jgi:hypothetical protein